jgi:Tfp pilus assembly protein PilZ
LAEKRLAKRITRRLPITFSNGKEKMFGTSSNISETGIFIKTRWPFSRGTIVSMILDLNEDQHIPLIGISMWDLKIRASEFKSGMGIKLLDMPQNYKSLVNQMLEHVH